MADKGARVWIAVKCFGYPLLEAECWKLNAGPAGPLSCIAAALCYFPNLNET